MKNRKNIAVAPMTRNFVQRFVYCIVKVSKNDNITFNVKSCIICIRNNVENLMKEESYKNFPTEVIYCHFKQHFNAIEIRLRTPSCHRYSNV